MSMSAPKIVPMAAFESLASMCPMMLCATSWPMTSASSSSVVANRSMPDVTEMCFPSVHAFRSLLLTATALPPHTQSGCTFT